MLSIPFTGNTIFFLLLFSFFVALAVHLFSNKEKWLLNVFMTAYFIGAIGSIFGYFNRDTAFSFIEKPSHMLAMITVLPMTYLMFKQTNIVIEFFLALYELILTKGTPAVEEVAPPPPPEPPPAPVTVPILPKALRLEHLLVLGGTGSGKTQLLSQLISRDIFTPCSIVVFDSQGDLLHNILKVNFPRERVVYIDPTDVENPVALSFFDFNTSGETTYEREKNFNSVVELLLFVLNSLDSSVTSKQELCLRFLIAFCLEIPSATIHTLRELLNESTYKQYTQHLPKLSDTAQAFFANDYLSRSFAETREQISRRVYTILQSPLERLFSAPKSRVNMREILDNGSIVLINTANSFLKAQGSAFLARFMTAMVFQAIQERNPLKDNLEVFMYIDEAAPVISDQITNILETARKYKLGLTLAFQSLSQVPTEYQQSIITNTSIKAVSGISAKDARALADDVGVKPEHLMATQKLTFFFYLKGVYLYPPYCPVEVGALGKLPQRTDLKQLIKENRAKYTQPRIMKQDATKPDEPDDDITGWKKS